MKKISIFAGFLTLLLAGTSMAAINPVTMVCTVDDDELKQTCSLTQQTTPSAEQPVRVQADNRDGTFGPYDSWSDVVADYLIIRNNAGTAGSSTPASKYYELNLKSDLVFPTYTAGAACPEAMTQTFDLFDVNFTFDGNYHTISNYCYAGDNTGKAGFFGSLDGYIDYDLVNKYIIKNVTFDNAYVRDRVSVTASPVESRAGIVAGKVHYATFDSVIVKNSQVHAAVAGGVVGFAEVCWFNGIKVADTDILMSSDIFPNNLTTTNGDIKNLKSEKGGLAGRVKVIHLTRSIEVTGTKIGDGDAVKYAYDDATAGNETAPLEGHSIAGGLIGYFDVGTTETSYENLKVDVSLGGNGMGGLFGQVYNTDHNRDMEIPSAEVTVDFKPLCRNTYSDGYFEYGNKNMAGGLIGSVLGQGLIKIDGATVTTTLNFDAANCDAGEKIASGSAAYYPNQTGLTFGGLIANSNGISGNLDIENNTISNEVSVNYPKTVNGTQIEVTADTLGGIAGSLNGDAFKITDAGNRFTKNVLKVTSAAEKITSDNEIIACMAGSYASIGRMNVVVTGLQMHHTLEIGGSAVYGSVHMAGVVAADDGNDRNIVIHYLTEGEDPFKNSISFETNDASTQVYMGGLVSSVNAYGIIINGNEFSSDLTVTGVATGTMMLGGLIASGRGNDYDRGNGTSKTGNLLLFENTVKGNVTVPAVSAGGPTPYVGGLAGKAEGHVEIYDNAVIGDISSEGATYLGYLVGEIYSKMLVQVVGNFHYGNSDSEVENPVGGYYDENAYTDVTDWKDGSTGTTPFSISHNYRNAVTGLDATTGWIWGMGAFLNAGLYYYNGVLSSDDMKSRALAHAMNKAVDDLGLTGDTLGTIHYDWTVDPTEDDYPELTLNVEKKFYAVYLDYSKLAGGLTESEKELMKDYLCEPLEKIVTFRENVSSNALTDDFIDDFASLAKKYLITNGTNKIYAMNKTREYTVNSDDDIYLMDRPMVDVSYEYYKEDGELAEIDDMGEQVYFTSARVDNVYMYDDGILIPDILVKTEDGFARYRVNRVYYTAQSGGDLAADPKGEVASFRDDNMFMLPEDMSAIVATMHLIYMESREEIASEISFASGSDDTPLRVSAYGSDKETSSVLQVGKSLNAQINKVNFVTKLDLDAGLGASVNSMKVDVWVNADKSNISNANIESCYDTKNAPDFCTDEATVFEGEETDFSSVDEIASQIKSANDDGFTLFKWTVDLSEDPTLDLNNLVLAISKTIKFSSNVALHIHSIPEVTFSNYTITFVPNLTDVFYGDSWLTNGGNYSLAKESSKLPMVYAVGRTLQGWNATKEGSESDADRKLNSDMLDEIEKNRLEDSDKTNLYGYWYENEVNIDRFIELKTMADSKQKDLQGSLVFTQSYESMEDGSKIPVVHPFQEVESPLVSDAPIAFVQSYGSNGNRSAIPMKFADQLADATADKIVGITIPSADEGMTFNVEALPNPGYTLKKLQSLNSDGAVSQNLTVDKDGVMTFKLAAGETGVSLEADFESIPYQFTLETTHFYFGGVWFYPRGWQDTITYRVDDAEFKDLPKYYSPYREFVGWKFNMELEEDYFFTEFDPNMTELYDRVLETYGALNLVMELKTRTEEEARQNSVVITAPEGGFVGGDLILLQRTPTYDQKELVECEHSFGESYNVYEQYFKGNELAIPHVNEIFDFTVSATAKYGYKFSKVVFAYTDRSTQEKVEKILDNGDAISIEPDRMENMTMDAIFEKIRYEVTYDLGGQGEMDDVIFEEGKLKDAVFVVDDDSDDAPSIPAYIYRSESCVVGWETEVTDPETGKNYVVNHFESSTSPAFKEGKNVLKAVWGDYKECDDETYEGDSVAGKYNRLVLDAKGIKVSVHRFVVLASGDSVEEVRYFGENNSMLFPQNTHGNYYTIEFEAAPGYELVSDTMYLDRKSSEKPGEFTDHKDVPNGGELFSYLSKTVLSGKARLINNTPLEFVRAELSHAGGRQYAVDFTTSEFALERRAMVRISFWNAENEILGESVVIEKIDSVPYVGHWQGVVPTGTDRLELELVDETGEAAAPYSFTIGGSGSGVYEVAADGWIMVSLAALDKKSVVWDDDPLFYWWDEQAGYGDYWQYQRFDKNDKVDPARGYWYNSLEGRSLKEIVDYEPSEEKFYWKVDSVYTGWNMVANPYSWNVSLPDSLEVVRWLPEVSDYDEASYLKPLEAVWVRSGEAAEIYVDPTPVYMKEDTLVTGDEETPVSGNAKRRALAKANSPKNWSIRPILRDTKGHTDALNMLGIGNDFQMDEPPSAMGDHVKFSIKDGAKFLAKSVKSSNVEDDYQWNVTLGATSDRFGYLRFEGLDRVADFGYHLYVTIDGRTSEVLPGDSLRVALKSSETNATVRITSRKLELVESFVGGLHMNMAGSMMKVGFRVDESLAGAPLQVDVLDMDGKVMATYSAKAVAGANMASLIAPKTGLYMLRVRVASHQTAGKIVVK